jgi:predicted GNAT family N-acyltransferase
MIQEILRNNMKKYLASLIFLKIKHLLILSRIVVNDSLRDSGVGTSIMNDLVGYADGNKQIVVLTPSNDFGNVNRLIQFYKKFGFKINQGIHKKL